MTNENYPGTQASAGGGHRLFLPLYEEKACVPGQWQKPVSPSEYNGFN